MQSQLEIRVHPLDLSEYGKNPQGAPIWRVVWADSRVEKFYYEGIMHESPLYEMAAGKWILEKWLSAEKFVGMTRTAYSELMLSGKFGGVQMEYPELGEYQLSEVFPGEVVPELARLWASQINYDQANFTNADRARAVREGFEKSARLKEEAKLEKIKIALTREG